MKKIRKTGHLLGCFLLTSTAAYATGTTIPTPASGLSISLTGYYLQPNANNLQYAVYTHPLPITRPNWSQIMLTPQYSPGFDLGLHYPVGEPVNRVNLDWFYLSTDESTSFSASGANSSIAPPYYFGPLAQALVGSFADDNVKFVVSNVGLTFSRMMNVSDHIQINPSAGLSFAYLKQEISSTYVGVDSSSEPYTISAYNTSKFTGLGPRLGIDATYFFTNRLGLMVSVGGSLLAGEMRSNTNFNSYGAGNTVAANTTLADQNENSIVPEADSKLELNYNLPINPNGERMTFALGYLFTAYFDGITQVVPTSLVPGAFNGGTIAIETSGQVQSNLNLNGPYATLVWSF